MKDIFSGKWQTLVDLNSATREGELVYLTFGKFIFHGSNVLRCLTYVSLANLIMLYLFSMPSFSNEFIHVPFLLRHKRTPSEHKQTRRQTDRQAGKHTDRQTDGCKRSKETKKQTHQPNNSTSHRAFQLKYEAVCNDRCFAGGIWPWTQAKGLLQLSACNACLFSLHA